MLSEWRPCRFVTDWMRQQETEAAEGLLRTAFNADRVGSVNMDFTVASMRSSPVYVPAYIFRSQHFGTKMRTFVSGNAPIWHSCILQLVQL